MTRHPVQSSNIKSIGHDPKTNTLEVEFGSGGVYQYHGVPAEEHSNLIHHPHDGSIGKHLHVHIKGKYACMKVSE